MARLQSVKTLAAQTWADSMECDTCGNADDALASAKNIYTQVGTAEDFYAKSNAIIALGKKLYNGEPTESKLKLIVVQIVLLSYMYYTCNIDICIFLGRSS